MCALEGGLLNLSEYLTNFQAKRVFLVLDPGLRDSNSYIKKVCRQISNFDLVIFSDFGTNPTTKQVNAASRTYRYFKPDITVAIGGGSAIDLAKATMLVGENGGVIEDYLAGKKGHGRLVPFIAAPSTCGTGSEGSPFAVIADHSVMKKRGIENDNFIPKLVILDPLLIKSLPVSILAASAIDALVHIIESFISKFSDNVTRSSCRGLLYGIRLQMENAAYKRTKSAFLEMQNNAFAARLLYPRTGLTIAHALSHPLGAYTNMHHGICVTFFLEESLKFNQDACSNQLDEALEIMGFSSLAKFNEWITEYCDKTGISLLIADSLKSKKLPIETIAKDAMESSNIPSNPKEITAEDACTIVNKSLKKWAVTNVSN